MKHHPVHVDLDRLEFELAAQSDLMENAILDLVEAKEALDVMEAKLGVVGAELSILIRSKPRKYGLKSVTEPGIKSAVLLQPEHKKAQWKVIRAKRKVGILQARVTALDNKKKSLEKLTDLYGQGYWSKPKIKKETEEKIRMRRRRERPHVSS